MRPVRVVLNAAGYSQWVPVAYNESWFGTTVAVVLSENASLTYSVQYTCDFMQANYTPLYGPISVARVTTTATVTDVGPYGLGHGLTTGDNVIIKGTNTTNLDSPSPTYGTGDLGWQIASTPSTTTYTYTVANSGATASVGSPTVARLRVFTHATLAAQTTRQVGSLNYPVRAVRLYISTYSAGYADMTILQGVSP
jgi:hypothetical protein